jgi:hypothetical protein
MKPARIFQQYVWIVTMLRQHGALTLEQLDKLWVDDGVGDGNPLARSTFNRHRDAIMDMFGLVIDCDRQHRYFISNPQAIGDDSLESWMLSTLTVGGVLADGNDIKDQILLEEVPAGEEFLHTLFVAVRSGRRIVIGYQRFGGEAYEKEVSPLAIRLFHRRWYLLAFTGRHTATYSLDRMKSVRMTDRPLEQPEGFSPQQYFSEYFGVLTDETPLQHVVLRAWGRQADYLRTLPLHHSQHEIGSTEQYTDFAFDIRPTADFLAELLSHGNGIEVLEPAHVRQRMKEILSESLKKY